MLLSLDYIVKKYHVKPKRVLHVGASTGQERNDYEKHGCSVTWIEADPETFKQLSENIKAHKSHIAFNYCISDTDDDEVNFYRTNNEGQSSSILELGTHSRMHPTVKVVDTIKLTTSRIDTLVYNGKIGSAHNFDFINFDIQGNEMKALKGMGVLLNGVKWAYLEVNWDFLYKGCALFDEVKDYLKGFGFEVAEFKESGRTRWGDCLFINKKL